jgi:drug/metabolite transporter (DMT)-like permease
MLFFIALVNALFAAVFPLGKLALSYGAPFFLIGVRMLLGGVLLLGYQYFSDRTQFTIKLSDLWTLFLLSLFNIYLANGLEFWGLQYMSSAKTAFIYNLAPFFSALFAYIHFDERMTLKKWLGLIISFLGFFPILMYQSSAELGMGHFLWLTKAEWAIVIATMAMVYGWILLQNYMRMGKRNIAMINGLSMIGGSAMSFAHSWFIEPWYPYPVIAWQPMIFWITSIIVLYNLIAYPLYAELLKVYTATFLVFTGISGPLFAAFYDWIFFNITVSWNFYLAMLFIACGLYLFYQEELKVGTVILKR